MCKFFITIIFKNYIKKIKYGLQIRKNVHIFQQAPVLPATTSI